MKIQKNLSHLTKNQIWNQILFVIENFHLTYKQILWVQTKFILETDSDTDFDNVRTIVQANWDDIINDEFQSKYLGCYNEITSESIFEKNKDVIIMQVLNFKNPKDVSYQLILMSKFFFKLLIRRKLHFFVPRVRLLFSVTLRTQHF